MPSTQRSRFAAEFSVLQFRELRCVLRCRLRHETMLQLGTLMGDNRNAPSWGETMVVDEKDQLTSKSTSSSTQNCCTAMKTHKAIPLPNPRSLIPVPNY